MLIMPRPYPVETEESVDLRRARKRIREIELEAEFLRKASADTADLTRNRTGQRPVLSKSPSQGDNPNTALTRPQCISPLTLVG